MSDLVFFCYCKINNFEDDGKTFASQKKVIYI